MTFITSNPICKSGIIVILNYLEYTIWWNMLTKALKKAFGLEEIIMIIILLQVDNVMEIKRIAILMLKVLEMFYFSFLYVFK